MVVEDKEYHLIDLEKSHENPEKNNLYIALMTPTSDFKHDLKKEQNDACVYPPPPPPITSTTTANTRRRLIIGNFHQPSLKERAQMFLDSRYGLAMESMNVFLSIFLVFLFVYQTYEENSGEKISPIQWDIEVAITIFFTIDFAIHLYAADDRLKHLMSSMSIIDLITILPTYLMFMLGSTTNSDLYQVIRVFRVFRALAVLRLYRIANAYYTGYDHELAVLILTIIAVIFIAAGTFQQLEIEARRHQEEEKQDPFQFHEAVYFVMVTMSTVGYGDITPTSTASQFFVMLMLIVVLTIIPRQISKLMELSRLERMYLHSYSIKRRGNDRAGGHVIVTGAITFDSVAGFLREFYHPRRGRVHVDVVILSTDLPSSRLENLLKNVKYSRRTTFLKGNLLHERDAERVHLLQADAVFILADKNNAQYHHHQSNSTSGVSSGSYQCSQDAWTILQALTLDKFRLRKRIQRLKKHPEILLDRPYHTEIKCFLQLVSPVQNNGLKTLTGSQETLNTPRLMHAILARSLLCPGAVALLMNLIYSMDEKELNYVKQHEDEMEWLKEYGHGLGHQIYPVVLPLSLHCVKYEQAACWFYLQSQILFIGVYEPNHRTTNQQHHHHHHQQEPSSNSGSTYLPPISLCPFGKILREGDLGFFIAPNASSAFHAVYSLETNNSSSSSSTTTTTTTINSNVTTSSTSTPKATTTTTTKSTTAVPSPFSLVFSSESVLTRQSFELEHHLTSSSQIHGGIHEHDESKEIDIDDESMEFLHSLVTHHEILWESDEEEEEEEEEEGHHPNHHDESDKTEHAEVDVKDHHHHELRHRRSNSNRHHHHSREEWHTIDDRTPLSQRCMSAPSPLLQGRNYHHKKSKSFSSSSSCLPLPMTPTIRRQLENHVIICGTFRQCHQMAWYLRDQYTKESIFFSPVVVLLVPKLPLPSDLEEMEIPFLPSNVYVEKGTPQQMKDLARFQAIKAQSVMMLPIPITTLDSPSHDISTCISGEKVSIHDQEVQERKEHLQDFQVIMSTLSIHSLVEYSYTTTTSILKPPPRIISMLKRHASVKYLSFKRQEKQLKRLLDDTKEQNQAETYIKLPAVLSPSYAAGEIFVENFLDALLCQSYFNPYIIELVRALVGDFPSSFKASNGNDQHPFPVLSIASTRTTNGATTFGQVFCQALEQQVLVLGIYRHQHQEGEASGKRGNLLQYVYTCPKNLLCPIEKDDLFYVLTQKKMPICIG